MGQIMAFVKFRYITKDRDRHGNLRYYFRRPGKPKVRLHGLPGSDEFMTAYKSALTENDPSEAKTEKSFDWLCDRYYKSAQFLALEEYTRRRKRTVLDEICDIAAAGGRRLGSAPFAALNTRKAAQKKLAASGAAKLGHAKTIVPPAVSPLKNINKNNNLKHDWCPKRDSNPHTVASNRF